MLAAGFAIPGSLTEAEQLKKVSKLYCNKQKEKNILTIFFKFQEHEQFQTAIEKTHASAVHVRQRAETLLNNNHYDPKGVKGLFFLLSFIS